MRPVEIKSVLPRFKRNRYSRAAIAADAIGITHFLIANIALVIGEVTDLFAKIDAKHGGVRFIYDYLDAPVFYFLELYIGETRADTIYMYIAAELVIIAASIVYALIAYIALKVISEIFR